MAMVPRTVLISVRYKVTFGYVGYAHMQAYSDTTAFILPEFTFAITSYSLSPV